MLVLVYVGAVMVLFLFVVMMLDINIEHCGRVSPACPARRADRGDHGDRLWYVLWVLASASSCRRHRAARRRPGNTAEIGAVLYPNTLPVPARRVVLLIAIVAAITLTMRKRPARRCSTSATGVGAGGGPRAAGRDADGARAMIDSCIT